MVILEEAKRILERHVLRLVILSGQRTDAVPFSIHRGQRDGVAESLDREGSKSDFNR